MIRPIKIKKEIPTQFSFIQALRGFAALWVVLFHLEKIQAISHFTYILPYWLKYALFDYGRAGVAVFFVLSGFVVAHSLERKIINSKEFFRFIIRRSIRLDPPYLVSIFISITVGILFSFAHHTDLQIPSFWQIVAHVLYVQELFHVPEIQIVYWTLTYEIQFYLVFALAKWIGWRQTYLPLYVLALVSATQNGAWAPQGLFVNLWHGFFIGVLAYRAGFLERRIWPLLFLAASTIIGQQSGAEVFALPCAVTGLVLFSLARLGMLQTALSTKCWQWLGAISYSLYLVHVPTLRLVTGALQRVTGRGAFVDLAAGVALVSACLAVASVFHWLIEKPSHALAKRLFRSAPQLRPQTGAFKEAS